MRTLLIYLLLVSAAAAQVMPTVTPTPTGSTPTPTATLTVTPIATGTSTASPTPTLLQTPFPLRAPGDVYAGVDGVGGAFYGDFAVLNGSTIWLDGVPNPWSAMPTPIAEAPIVHVDDIIFEVHYQTLRAANLFVLNLPWDDKILTVSDVWIDRFQLQYAQDYWFEMGSSGVADGAIVMYTEMEIPVGTWITIHFCTDEAPGAPNLYEFYFPESGLFATDPNGSGYIAQQLIVPPKAVGMRGLSSLGRSW